MNTLSETVRKYLLNTVKVVKTVKEDHTGYLIYTKTIYLLGARIYQLSTCRKRGIKDSIVQLWGGDLQWNEFGGFSEQYQYC